jgi:hypothetical protein
MMTRRTFLRAAMLCGAPAAAGALIWRDSLAWVVDRSARSLSAIVRSPEDRLQSHFSYLKLDPAGVARFFADRKRYRPTFSRRLPLGPDVCTDYLLSTDFFSHGADESRVVRYVGFYDPAVTACSNPLATFEDPVEA